MCAAAQQFLATHPGPPHSRSILPVPQKTTPHNFAKNLSSLPRSPRNTTPRYFSVIAPFKLQPPRRKKMSLACLLIVLTAVRKNRANKYKIHQNWPNKLALQQGAQGPTKWLHKTELTKWIHNIDPQNGPAIRTSKTDRQHRPATRTSKTDP